MWFCGLFRSLLCVCLCLYYATYSIKHKTCLSCLDTPAESEEKRLLLQLKRDHTVKDLTQKLSNMPLSPPALSANVGVGVVGIDGVDKSAEAKQRNILISAELTGLISKAKEGLEKSKSKGEITRTNSVDQSANGDVVGGSPLKLLLEPKKSENELHWEELVSSMARPLRLCDLDFTDLQEDDDKDDLAPRCLGGSIPPPPPPLGFGGPGMCPPPPAMGGPPVAPMNLMGPPPPFMNLRASPLVMNNGAQTLNGVGNGGSSDQNGTTAVKTKKTVSATGRNCF